MIPSRVAGYRWPDRTPSRPLGLPGATGGTIAGHGARAWLLFDPSELDAAVARIVAVVEERCASAKTKHLKPRHIHTPPLHQVARHRGGPALREQQVVDIGA